MTPAGRDRHAVWKLGEAEWRAFDAAHPAPTYFARPGWAAAFRATYPRLYDVEPLVVDLGSHGGVLVPVLRCGGSRLSPWRSRLAMPLGTYSCAMTLDGRVADGALAARAIRAVGERSDALSITPWPLHPERVDLETACAEHQTWVVDLRGGAEAAIGRFKDTTRRTAAQTVRRGIRCARDGSAAGLEAYAEMLDAAARRRGQPRFPIPRALLAAVVRHGGDDVELWFASYGDERLAGVLVLNGSAESFSWTAAIRPEFGYLRPNLALHVALIRAAAERGLRWYNMGSSEGCLPGVARFKRSLGAAAHDYRTYEFASRRYAAFRRLRDVTRGIGAADYSNAIAPVSGRSSDGGGAPDEDTEPPSSAPPPLSASVRR